MGAGTGGLLVITLIIFLFKWKRKPKPLQLPDHHESMPR
jgi:hypothetical protein